MTNFSGLASAFSIALVCVSACAGAAPRPPAADRSDRLWVLAPHPDDEVLMAGEQLRRAVATHRPVSVLVMTNGDLGCERNGYRRESETIAALATLGVLEADVHFLGYPDGYLEVLGAIALEPIARALPDGSCGTGTGTYAVRGAGGADVHSVLFGAPGAYIASGPVDDLAELLVRERPTEIVVAHPIDTHPDHAMTYVYLHRALERAHLAVAPAILRAVVHQGACWPNGAGSEPCPEVPTSFGTPVPPFAAPLDAYAPTLRVTSDDGGAAKRHAIASYTSQLGTPIPEQSWLSSFARTDEVFWPVALVDDPRHPGHLVRERAGAVSVASADVVLGPDGSAFFELGGVRLSVDREGTRLSRGAIELRRMPWPHGDVSTDRHAFELRIDPRPSEGGVAEISVRRDGTFLSLAVIPWDLAELLHVEIVSGAERATVEPRGIIAE